MPYFLITFFFLYSLLHAYLIIKIYKAFHFKTWLFVFTGALMVLLIILPVLTRFFEKASKELPAVITAYTGYTWMAMIFIFFVLHLFFDIVKLFFSAVCWVLKRDFSIITDYPRAYFIVACFVSLAISGYGYYEASNIKLERITIYTEKLPEDIGKIKIIQISDLHIGTVIKNNRLKKIIDLIRKENPDILLSTGDLIDRRIQVQINGNSGFKQINPKLGKYAVLGNHEFYTGIKNSIEFLQDEGFIILRGKAININDIINIAGVDDPAGKPFNYIEIAEKDLLKNLPENRFTILLKHQPRVDMEAVEHFDLQLSGHTHGGQIYPFRYLTRIFYPFPSGLVELSKDKFLYTSRGTGIWGPPIRFLSPPEITVIELCAK